MVFEDRSGWRPRALAALLAVVVAALAFVIIDHCIVLFVAPSLPALALCEPHAPRRLYELDASEQARPRPMPAAQAPADLSQRPFLRTAFLVQDDPASVASLRSVLPALDMVFPDWLSFSTDDGRISEHVAPAVAALLDAGPAAVLPRLSNTDARGAWHADAVSGLLRDPYAKAELIDQVIESLQRLGARGVDVDIENLNPGDGPLLTQWLDDLSGACHARGLLVCVDVPVNDRNFDYEAIGAIADYVVVMAYDQSFASGRPGPIAGEDWFTDALETIGQQVPHARLLLALGAYGYDWNTSTPGEAASLSFHQAMELAAEYDADVQARAPDLNPHFSYADQAGRRHQVWFLDAVSAWNELQRARRLGVRGVSVWRLGLEEPAIWKFLSAAELDGCGAAALETVAAIPGVASTGDGELFRVTAAASPGIRALSMDGGLVDWAAYERLPQSYVVEKCSKMHRRRVALTFDDGPDPRWTPQILDILRRHDARATFFVVGQQAQQFPELVRREVEEGHLLGNHTFSHPDLRTLGRVGLGAELNAAQRIIEAVCGRKTVLFRAPYDTDSSPHSLQELAPLGAVTQLGYICAGADIDAGDYRMADAGQMFEHVMSALQQGSGDHVIVLHDGGGDRAATVALMEHLVPWLMERGFDPVAVSELADYSTDEMMPRVAGLESAVVAGAGAWSWSATTGWRLVMRLFWIVLAVAIVRIVALGVLVFRRTERAARGGHAPAVTVLVPAYNEAKVIGRTLDALLASGYENLSVLVIDDGSTDGTADVVMCRAQLDGRVRLLRRPNGGKSAALNAGLHATADEIVVTIDADTVVQSGAIRALVEPMADRRVDAVCGNVQVGNVRNVLTAFQDVEYVTSQNYDRRAFETLNCIGVVPGATGAWRRLSVLRVGGYSTDTLTEDADLTLTLLRAGGRIAYAPAAHAVTEAPETTRALFRQRFRWSFGTFQCLWKHRAAIGRGTLGWVALPNLLLFQVLFPLLSPIGDLVFLASIVRGDWSAVAIGYSVFLLLDLIGSYVAFRLDGRDMRRLWVVLIQRLFYRQFMYVVAFVSAGAMLRGRRHGWNKIERSAAALVPAAA